MTQRELADAVGWNKSLIAKIELGERRVDLIELYWLTTALGFDPKEEVNNLMQAISDVRVRLISDLGKSDPRP